MHAPALDRPVLVGDGPAECSTSVALVSHPLVIFDTNGYYRALGVDPRCSRKELRRAYMEKEGFRSDHLTYIMTVLCNPERRRKYDCTPLGALFVDMWIEEADLKRKAARIFADVVERIARYKQFGVDIDEHQAFEELDAEGRWNDDEEDFIEALDTFVIKRQYGDPSGWNWSFYTWRVEHHQVEVLQKWQEALVSALSVQRPLHRFAVGIYDGHQGSWSVQQVGLRTVIFLSEEADPVYDVYAEEVARTLSPASTEG